MALGVSRIELMEAHWQDSGVPIKSILFKCGCCLRLTIEYMRILFGYDCYEEPCCLGLEVG